MKKCFSLILVLVLALTMAVSAFAEDVIQSGTGKSEQQIDAKYEKGTIVDPEAVYHITVTWDVSGNLQYSEGTTTISWNPNNTEYVATTEGEGWTGTATVTVTVENRSNAEVKATAAWKSVDAITGSSANFVGNGATVESAAKDVPVEGGKTGKMQSEIITGTIQVTEGTITETDRTIGTVTLTIEPTQP